MSGRHNRVKCQSAAILMSAASRIKTWAISRDSGSCQWAASEPWCQQGEYEGGRNWHQIEARELLRPKLNSMHAWFNKKQNTKEAMYPLWSCICICCWVAPCSISAINSFSLLLKHSLGVRKYRQICLLIEKELMSRSCRGRYEWEERQFRDECLGPGRKFAAVQQQFYCDNLFGAQGFN